MDDENENNDESGAHSLLVAVSIKQESDEGIVVPQAPLIDPNKILPVLSCPVCLDDLVPPIFQCREGHTLCSGCREKVPICPTCRRGTIDIRNRGLETLAESLKTVSCRYRADGCYKIVEYLAKKQHESECLFMPIRCLHNDSECAFQGLSDNMVKHLIAAHSYGEHKTDQIDFFCNILPRNRPGSVLFGENQMYSCLNSHFLLRVNACVAEERLTFNISLVELASSTISTYCQLKIKLSDQKEREFSYEGPVWSMERLSNSVKLPRDSMLIPGNFGCSLSAFRNVQITGKIYQHELAYGTRRPYDRTSIVFRQRERGSNRQMHSGRQQPYPYNNERSDRQEQHSERRRGLDNNR